jgi:hypothetical protein
MREDGYLEELDCTQATAPVPEPRAAWVIWLARFCAVGTYLFLWPCCAFWNAISRRRS